MKVKLREKKLLRRLCPTFTPSFKGIQADHVINIDHVTRICLTSSNTRDKIRTQNPTKLQEICYKSVIIHKNRIDIILIL